MTKFRETRRRLVRVGEQRTGGTYPIRWIRLLDGEKQGLDFAIPMWHERYTDNMVAELEGLETDDILKMRFTCLNERETEWVCSEVTDRDGTIRATQSIP